MNELTIDQKRKLLLDWIKSLDEEAIDILIEEYIDIESVNL
jgi:hypothetical protein